MHIIDYVSNCVMGLHIDEYFAHVVNFWLGLVCSAKALKEKLAAV